jgi:hypothetical protein
MDLTKKQQHFHQFDLKYAPDLEFQRKCDIVQDLVRNPAQTCDEHHNAPTRKGRQHKIKASGL